MTPIPEVPPDTALETETPTATANRGGNLDPFNATGLILDFFQSAQLSLVMFLHAVLVVTDRLTSTLRFPVTPTVRKCRP